MPGTEPLLRLHSSQLTFLAEWLSSKSPDLISNSSDATKQLPMHRGVINLSYALLSFVLLRGWRLESMALRSSHYCFPPVEEITWEWREATLTSLFIIFLGLIQGTVYFFQPMLFSTVMLCCLFHILFSSLGLPWCLMFYQNCVNWRPRLVDPWWSTPILADPCSSFGSSFPWLSPALAIW